MSIPTQGTEGMADEELVEETVTTPKGPAPLIIWTFRRTGGTNLGAALFGRLSYPKVEHEPFNTERAFGHVTRAFRDTRDERALEDSLREICSRKVLIKHCVELMPPELNAALARATVAAGYNHLFLYRRQAFGRLLSLYFAQRSGIWGKKAAGQAEIDDAVFAEPLPVTRIVEHERQCRRQLKAVYQQLRAAGIAPACVAFEDIYVNADAASVEQVLLGLLEQFGMRGDEEQDRAFMAHVGGGEQGTRDKYARFVNYDKLGSAIESLGELNITEPELTWSAREELPAGLDRLTIWPPIIDRAGGRIALSGLLLQTDGSPAVLRLDDAAGSREVAVGLPSPAFAAQIPDVPAASHARFRIDDVRLDAGTVARLYWDAGGGEEVELASLQRDGGPEEALDI